MLIPSRKSAENEMHSIEKRQKKSLVKFDDLKDSQVDLKIHFTDFFYQIVSFILTIRIMTCFHQLPKKTISSFSNLLVVVRIYEYNCKDGREIEDIS